MTTTRRRLRPEEARLWSVVVSTVRRAHSAARAPAEVEPVAEPLPVPSTVPSTPPARRPPRPLRPSAEALTELASRGVGARPTPRPPPPHAPPDPGPIEPNRKRRIARAREPIGARLDLHGLDQDRARATLHAFILRAQEDGTRAVLVITGKGRTGAGVLRSRVPEWLGEAPARAAVAGVSPAEVRHGGEGALYVALKRKP